MGNSNRKPTQRRQSGKVSSVIDEIQINKRKQSNIRLKLPPASLPKFEINDYRISLINAYIHQIQKILSKTYKETEFETFSIIPASINISLISFYPLYQIYGIGGNLITVGADNVLKTFLKLDNFENIISNPANVYHGKFRHFIKDFWGSIYGHGWNQNDDLGLNYVFKGGNYRFITEFQKTAFMKYLIQSDKGQKVDFIGNAICALQNSEPLIVFKLENGSIYYSKRLKNQLIFERLSKQYINTIQIECGDNFVLFLMSNGTVYSMGNIDGKTMIYDPVLIDKLVNESCFISSISCGMNHCCCIDKNKYNLWVWGHNGYNKCSNTVNDIDIIQIPILSDLSYNYNIIKVGCGYLFSLCLTDKQEIYILGALKQFVDDSWYDIKFIDFSVGSDHIVLISQHNDIYTLGNNTWNECGVSNHQIYKVTKPYLLQKTMFPQLQNSNVNRVIAGVGHTIIIFD